MAGESGFGRASLLAAVDGRSRRDVERQRALADDAFGPRDPRLARAHRAMETSLETPLSVRQLAAQAGISVRQLERLVRSALGVSPMRYYLKLRRQAAQPPVLQPHANPTGCRDLLSRTFRAHFGIFPRAFRARFSGDQLQRFHPEIRQQLASSDG